MLYNLLKRVNFTKIYKYLQDNIYVYISLIYYLTSSFQITVFTLLEFPTFPATPYIILVRFLCFYCPLSSPIGSSNTIYYDNVQ